MTVKIKANLKLQALVNLLTVKSYDIKVGVLADPKGTNVKASTIKKLPKTNRPKKGKRRSKGRKQITVIEVARIHEFGTKKLFRGGGVPKRSFLVSTYKLKKEAWTEAYAKLVRRVQTEEDYIKALNRYGALMQRDVRLTFTNNNWKPLKYRQGNPLLNSGQLRRSIGYSVEEVR